MSSYIRSRCGDLARLGYVVLAPEIYWRLPDHEIDENRGDAVQQAMALARRLDWDLAVADATSALAALRELPQTRGGSGVIGFCFGGGLAFTVAAVAEPDVLVSYYGSVLGDLIGLVDQVDAPSLYHFGLADAFIPGEVVGRIKTAVTSRPATVLRPTPVRIMLLIIPRPNFIIPRHRRWPGAAPRSFSTKSC